MEIISLREHPEYADAAAGYYSAIWGIPRAEYEKSIADAISTKRGIPRWYLLIDGEKFCGGFGLIENDFMVRKDLCPWFCALYVEQSLRGKQIGSRLLECGRREAAALGYKKLYLCTDHVGYYEKYGWEYMGDFESEFGGLTRVYTAETIPAPSEAL